MEEAKKKNLITRSLSGMTLLIVVLVALFVSKYTFLALILLIGVGVMSEFFKLSSFGPSKTGKTIAFITGAAIIAFALLFNNMTAYIAILPLVALIFILELYRCKDNPLENIAVTLCGIVYSTVPMALLVALSTQDGNYEPKVALLFFMTIWINDVFAYLIGMSIGRRHLMERISPKKSWEGFWGGVIFATAFNAAVGHITENNIFLCGGFGLVVSISSVFGDLVESMFKRAAKVKDSGNIIPGHGGFMDRFDAMLLSLPFAYCYYVLLTPFMF